MSADRCLIVVVALLALLAAGSRSAAQTDLAGDPLPAGAIGRLGTTRLRHGTLITALTYLPDGKTLASLDRDGLVVLWDVATGRERRHYRIGPSAYLDGPAAFSADRTRVATAAADGFSVFDLASGKRLHRHGGAATPHADYTPFTFSGDGRLMARLSKTHERVLLVDIAGGKERPALSVNRSLGAGLPALLASPDGKLLVSSSVTPNDIRVAVVWDLAGGKRLYDFETDVGEWMLVFTPDGKTLAHVTANRTAVVLREAATGKELHRFAVGHLAALAFSGDSKTLAIALNNGKIRLWDLSHYEEGHTLTWRGGWVQTELFFSRDGRLLGALHGGANDACLQVWQLPAGKELLDLDIHRFNARAGCAFSDDGLTVAAALGNRIGLWEVATGKRRAAHSSDDNPLVDVAIAANGQAIATAGVDGTIRLFDRAKQVEQARWATEHRKQTRLAFAADGKTLTSAGMNGDLAAVWDVSSRHLLHSVKPPKDASLFALAPQGRLVAWATPDGIVHLIEPATGAEQSQFRIPQPAPPRTRDLEGMFAPDGRRLLARIGPEFLLNLWQWDLTAGRALPPPDDGRRLVCNAVTYSPDGRLVAAMVWNSAASRAFNEIRIWEAATGQTCLVIAQPAGDWRALDFAPDCRRLALGGADGTIRLCDSFTGKELGHFDGHLGAIAALRFAPDGRTLYSVSADTTVLIWYLARFAPDPAAAVPIANLDALWTELADIEAAKAYCAVGTLVSIPKQAVALLAGRLKPVTPLDEKQVRRWIAELDSDDFELRQHAFRELERLGRPVEQALQEALRGNVPLEQRRRLEQLIKPLLQPLPPAELQALRAVQALELIGTPEARAVLQSLVTGAVGARQTREARESLDRLEKRVATTAGY